MSKFIRNFTKEKIDELKTEDLFNQKLIDDITKCEKNAVFPALRNGYISFYYKGGGLFNYNGDFTTHYKYGTVPKDIDKDYVSQDDLTKVEVETSFVDGYDKIKERCDKYGTVEADGVSNLYKYNVTHKTNDIVLLDTEIAFTGDGYNIDENTKTTQNRIDLLLFNKSTQTLLFVEAKHFSNKELWATKGTKPKVVEQIKKYESEISQRKLEIIEQYTNYVNQINILFNLQIPVPTELCTNVGLLIFGFDINQKNKIKTLLIEDESLDGISHYAIGDISSIKTENLYNSIVSKENIWEED